MNAVTLDREAVEILKQAQTEIEVCGRTVGEFERPNGTVCALGALNRAERNLRMDGKIHLPTYAPFHHELTTPTILARRALDQVARDVYGRSVYYAVNDNVHVELDVRGHKAVTDESTEEVLEDIDIAITYIKANKIDRKR